MGRIEAVPKDPATEGSTPLFLVPLSGRAKLATHVLWIRDVRAPRPFLPFPFHASVLDTDPGERPRPLRGLRLLLAASSRYQG